jgi:hypothetical protein
VGDQDDGAPGHQTLQRRLDLGLALGVERAGGLVEQQDRGVLQEGAGDGDPLPLTAGEPRARLADAGVVALGQRQDEVVGGGGLGGAFDLGLGGLRPRVGDVGRGWCRRTGTAPG